MSSNSLVPRSNFKLQLRIARKRLKDAIDTIAYELQILSDKL